MRQYWMPTRYGPRQLITATWKPIPVTVDVLAQVQDLAQLTVVKYMVRKSDPSGQSWGMFLRNHAPHIAAMDLFMVHSPRAIKLLRLILR